jgi:hypothetical protein
VKPIVINIQPISFQLTEDLTSLLEQHISKQFDTSVIIASPLDDNQLPVNLFDKSGKQWKSDKILWLLDKNKPGKDNKILAIL